MHSTACFPASFLFFLLASSVWLSSSTAVLPQGCSYPLGMENKQIPDAQITASSEYNSAHGASNGRLNFQSGGGKTGAWSARTSDVNQWLKVDMGKRKMITGIKTQGRAEANQWVTSYTISYSDDGATFTSYAQSQVFQANSDRSTVVLNVLSTAINARYIRVHPKTWSGHISMRMELMGCPVDTALDPTSCNSMKAKGFCSSGDIQARCPSQCPPPCSNYMPDSGCKTVRDNGGCKYSTLFSLCSATCFKCDAYVSKGCWIDINADRIMGTFLHQDFSDPTIVEVCSQKAAARGFSTFGVEAGGQCFSGVNAGLTFKKHGQAPDGDCLNGKGANFRMSVYQFGTGSEPSLVDAPNLPALDSASCNFLNGKGFCASVDIQTLKLCPTQCLPPPSCSNTMPDVGCDIVKNSGSCNDKDMFALCRKACSKCEEIYVPKGCWIDVNADRIMGSFLHQDFSDPTIVKICAQKAAARGFSTFGVEAGGQCFSGVNAGLTFKKHGQAPDGDCLNGKGANFRMSVYQFV